MADVHVVEDNDENSSNGAEAGPSTSRILVQFRLCSTKGSDVHKFFFVQLVNGHKTDVRKSIKCSTNVKCPNSGTTAVHRHKELCTKKQDMKRPADQSALQYPVAKVEKKIGLNKVCRLVYKDGFAITAVVNSETLHAMFKLLNYSRVTHNSLNISLEETYQAVFAKIKKFVAERDRKQVVVIYLDK